MILFLTTGQHDDTLIGIRRSPYRRFKLRCRSYDWLFRQSRIRASAVILTDFERLRHHELVRLAQIYRRLREAGLAVLNDPARVLLRADLLSVLAERGLNPFGVYPAGSNPRPARFPVFLKCEDGHDQHFDRLVGSQEELEAHLEEVRAQGFPLGRVLVTEFANTPMRPGIFRRHTINRVGKHMIPGNPVTEARPFVKYGEAGLATMEEYERGMREMQENPHAEHMRQVFEIAGIDYGRADFGFYEGRIATYEINTNPSVGLKVITPHEGLNEAVQEGMRALMQAFGEFDGPVRSVPIAPKPWHIFDLKPHAGLRLPLP